MGEEKTVTASVKVSNCLETDLREAARQDGRKLGEECAFFIKAMLAVANQQPIPLLRDYGLERGSLYRQLKFSVDFELGREINGKAREYGLNYSEFVRLLLMVALDLRKMLPPRRLLRKEDFLNLVLKKNITETIH